MDEAVELRAAAQGAVEPNLLVRRHLSFLTRKQWFASATRSACWGWTAEMTTTTTMSEARLGARLYSVADWYDAESLLTGDSAFTR